MLFFSVLETVIFVAWRCRSPGLVHRVICLWQLCIECNMLLVGKRAEIFIDDGITPATDLKKRPLVKLNVFHNTAFEQPF